MANVKNEPLRMCAVSRELYPRSQLVRLVKVDNEILIDNYKKLSGRGIYIKKDINTLLLAKKRKVLERAFKCETNKIYQKLEKILNGNQDL